MKHIAIRFMLFAALVFILDSCKKKEEPPKEIPVPEESAQSSEDNRDAQAENDAVTGDINNVIGDENSFSGRLSSSAASGVTGTLCGMTADKTNLGSGILTLNFDTTTCNNRTRTGSVKLTVIDHAKGKRWKQAGCTIQVDYINYKVVRASDQKSIEFNGTQFLTNVSGGTWWNLLILKDQSSLVSTITGTNLSVKFSDGKKATYNFHRQVTYSYPNNVLTVKGEGIGANAGVTQLENYGTTRDGDAFYSQVSTPIIWNTTCGAGAPLQGDVTIKLSSKAFGLRCVFGTDNSGNPVTVGANQCPFGWRFEWTVNGSTQTRVFGYK